MAERSPRASGERPSVSIVVVAPEWAGLLAFLESLDVRGGSSPSPELVVVVDGGDEASRAAVDAWRARTSIPVTVVERAATGAAGARAAGLEAARGDWVTFANAATRFPGGFLASAVSLGARHPDLVVLAGGRGGGRRDAAPAGTVIDVEREPPALGDLRQPLVRLDAVRAAGLGLDPRVGAGFDVARLAAWLLLDAAQPRVGVLGTAPATTPRAHDGRLVDVFEHGYVATVRQARTRRGRVPAWLQHLLVDELAWYLQEDERVANRVELPDPDVAAFHEQLDAVLRELDPEVVAAHPRRLRPAWRDILAHAGRGTDWHAQTAAATTVDEAMRLMRVTYRFTGELPAETVTLDGSPIAPAWAKTQANVYYRRPLLRTRILWLPMDPRVALVLDGTPVPIGREPEPGTRIGAAGARPRGPVGRATRLAGRIRAAVVRADARRRAVAGRYRDAWVFMDRPDEADDNAERLFEHVREHRPDINAWFAIGAGVTDHARLRAAYGERVVARHTREFRRLMLNAAWLVSSHADRAITAPAELDGILEQPTWRYAFLQHGVTKDDLSAWLNRKQASLFVVSTQAELASVAGDGTAYWYTHKEARDTGLPRFDRLLRKAREVGPDDRTLVIVAPTWRSWLTSDMDIETFRREVLEAVGDSAYLRSWLAVLRSERVAAAADAAGFTLAFMPHPAMQPLLARLDLPPHVRPLSFHDEDVQGLYARCALLVTDYSSVAFNVAYVDGPVVYFQFDREQVLGGQHLGRAGYFDYARDGFGPVTTTVDEAVDAIVAQLGRGATPAPAYAARIAATFPRRDGRCCERVVAAIEELGRPYPWPAEVQAVLDRPGGPAATGTPAGSPPAPRR